MPPLPWRSAVLSAVPPRWASGRLALPASGHFASGQQPAQRGLVQTPNGNCWIGPGRQAALSMQPCSSGMCIVVGELQRTFAGTVLLAATGEGWWTRLPDCVPFSFVSPLFLLTTQPSRWGPSSRMARWRLLRRSARSSRCLPTLLWWVLPTHEIS
jgi:hypothetical protein